MRLPLPSATENALHEYEQHQTIEEVELGTDLGTARSTNDPENVQLGGWAEMAAFTFMPSHNGQASVWGTYFGPVFSGTRTDGVEVHSPDIKEVTAEVLGHWSARSRETNHPVMKARYADLLWELSKTAGNVRPDVSNAQTAIDSYLESVAGSRYEHLMTAVRWLLRALRLALAIRDQNRVAKVRDALFDHYRATMVPHEHGSWMYLYDEVLTNRKVPLEDEHELFVIESLEDILVQCSSRSTNHFDPWGAQAAAERLANYYHKESRPDEVRRVMKTSGLTWEDIAKDAAPLLAMSWLAPVHDAYRNLGMTEDATRIQLALTEKGKLAPGEMKTIAVPVEVSREEAEAAVNTFMHDTLSDTLQHVSRDFVPKTAEAKNLLNEMIKESPLLALMRVTLIENSQQAASAGSVLDDIDGRVIMQLAQTTEMMGFLLAMTIDRVRQREDFSVENVLACLYEGACFDSSRRTLIEEGIVAYIANDHVKAIHVLIPQLEHCLRSLLGLLGVPVSKPRGQGTGLMHQKNLNDILGEAAIKKVLGEDISNYFTALLADPRGWNIRNNVSHGLWGSNHFGRIVADRVFHVLLVLAQFHSRPVEGEQKSEYEASE